MQNSQSNTESLTIALHGLYHSPRFVGLLSKRLQKAGFATYAHHYRSLKDDIHTHAKNLHRALESKHDPKAPLHFVAHSLGGLVARQFIDQYHTRWRIGRVVTLGTPHTGSVCAAQTHRLLPWLLGRSYRNALDGDCPPLPDFVELGVISGTTPLGLGSPILYCHNRFGKDKIADPRHDGAVYLFESNAPYAKDRLIAPLNHVGLLVSADCAHQAAHFLRTGEFQKSL